MDPLKNSLSSLSHNTPYTHTGKHAHTNSDYDAATEEDDPNGDEAYALALLYGDVDNELNDDQEARPREDGNPKSCIQREFIFKEFYSLARKVINE
ncbi:UNVERIFIED_CONTAM: hypothetical protein Sradi_4529400 [Sesamum radiatum]|uniref:Uncharacterized protein n=1 Tax=Sesamum radiatum TaxID=300843 RepID=A0AAW2N9K4_SESRA